MAHSCKELYLCKAPWRICDGHYGYLTAVVFWEIPPHPLTMVQSRSRGRYPRVVTCVLSKVGQPRAQNSSKQQSYHDRGERPGANQQPEAARDEEGGKMMQLPLAVLRLTKCRRFLVLELSACWCRATVPPLGPPTRVYSFVHRLPSSRSSSEVYSVCCC